MGVTIKDVSHAADHRQAVALLVRYYGWRSGAELGLGGGHLSRRLLRDCPKLEELYGVDTLRRPDRAARVREIEREHWPRYILLHGYTRVVAQVAPRRLEFIFIDAGHSYEAVAEDIELWGRKVVPGGAILGHDYGHPKYTGVARAVDEAYGDRVELLGHTIWGVRVPPC